MKYMYGEFSDNQIQINEQLMHNEIHKLLLYKDNKVTEEIFRSNEDFICYFNNLLYRFGGLNTLLGEPPLMVSLMSTLQAAKNEVEGNSFEWKAYRRLILDAHGFIKSIFEGVN